MLPWFNGVSITARWPDLWIIDFSGLTETEAVLFEAPFDHVVRVVKPAKLAQARESRRLRWWLFNEPAPKLRAAVGRLHRIAVAPEVAKHRMAASRYPDRIVAKPGHAAELAKRTLTNLYNALPTWLGGAHAALDAAMAAAYGWTDNTPTMPDDEILRRLLALNRARAAAG